MESLFVPFRAERVIARRDGILVVDKPPGIVVHGGDERLRHDLVTRLSLLQRAAGEPEYLGVHSRLDVGTSGVLPFTTQRDANEGVAREIAEGQSARVYLAAVALGKRCRLRDAGRLSHQLLSDGRRTRVVASGGERAVAEYRVLHERGGRALLELRPETGRFHQLRAQLSAEGAPIAGDELYGGAMAWRLMLHCRSRRVLGARYESPEPPELRCWVNQGTSFAPLAHFEPRLLDAAALRWPLLAGADVFRVVNDAGDGLPGITLDRYADFCVLSLTTSEAEQHAQAIARALHARGVAGVYLKRRERRDLRRADTRDLAPELPLQGEPAPSPLVVREADWRLQVELADGLSTGLFVDQRENRRRVAQLGQGKQVLNLFAYTCSFSVAAARGGAAKVTSVDLSGRALARGRSNFSLNQLAPEQHDFVQADAVRFVRGAVKHGRRFGLIVLDPPSFASVGRATFRFERDVQSLMADCLRLLEPGGALLCVTNHQKTSPAAFRRLLLGAAEQARVALSLREPASPLDCPRGLEGPHPSKSLLATAVVGKAVT